MKYTQEQLEQMRIMDLETDLRCAERDGLKDYADEIRAELTKLRLDVKGKSTA